MEGNELLQVERVAEWVGEGLVGGVSGWAWAGWVGGFGLGGFGLGGRVWVGWVGGIEGKNGEGQVFFFFWSSVCFSSSFGSRKMRGRSPKKGGKCM